MLILVPIKRVPDPYSRIRIKPDGSGIDTQSIKMVINPFDEIALEQALRFREAGLAQVVKVVSIGEAMVTETLRAALALGADAALHINTTESYEPLNIATILAAIVRLAQPHLVLMGKQATDDDNNQTGQCLAGLLNWPQATFASHIEIDQNAATVTREKEDGLETLQVLLPAVITVDLRLNQPRYPHLRDIMQAKSKPLSEYSLNDLNVTLTPHQKILNVSKPAERRSGVILQTVQELVTKLRDEAHVI